MQKNKVGSLPGHSSRKQSERGAMIGLFVIISFQRTAVFVGTHPFIDNFFPDLSYIFFDKIGLEIKITGRICWYPDLVMKVLSVCLSVSLQTSIVFTILHRMDP